MKNAKPSGEGVKRAAKNKKAASGHGGWAATTAWRTRSGGAAYGGGSAYGSISLARRAGSGGGAIWLVGNLLAHSRLACSKRSASNGAVGVMASSAASRGSLGGERADAEETLALACVVLRCLAHIAGVEQRAKTFWRYRAARAPRRASKAAGNGAPRAHGSRTRGINRHGGRAGIERAKNRAHITNAKASSEGRRAVGRGYGRREAWRGTREMARKRK
jgi:hypothetical protein